MDNYLNDNLLVFIIKDHVKLLLLSWLFWINLSELQAKYSSEEIVVNNGNSCVPIKCTNVTNQLRGHCFCPKSDREFKSFLCQFHASEGSTNYEEYLCSCDHHPTETNTINCKCVSQKDSLTVKCDVTSNRNIIKVGILMSYTANEKVISSGYLLGLYYASAMFVARDDINQNKFLLPNHRFDLVWGDTECNKKKTVKLAMKMIEEQQVDAIIGVGCDGCLAIAAISGIYNIPMISHMCIEKELSDKSKYPIFARTAVTGYELASIVHELARHYKWRKISVIWHDRFPYKKLYEEFHGLYEEDIVSAHLMEVKAYYDYSKHHNLTRGYLKKISSKSKIIICLVQIALLKEVLIAASELNMTNGEFAFVGFELDIDLAWNRQSLPFKWALPDIYAESPNSVTGIRRNRGLCDGLQVLLLLLPDLASYRSNDDFEERVRNKTKNKLNSEIYTRVYPGKVKLQPPNLAWSLYDAIMLYANAVNNTMNKGEDFRNGRTVMKNIKEKTFLGADNYQILVDKNLEARQPFKLYRYGKNHSSNQICLCSFYYYLNETGCLPDYPKMEPIAYFQVLKTNKTVVRDGAAVTVTNIGYQYKDIPSAPTYWPGKKGLKDLEDHSDESVNGSKESEEKERKSKPKLAIIIIPTVFIGIVLIVAVVVIFRRRWFHQSRYHRKISKKELIDDDGNMEL